MTTNYIEFAQWDSLDAELKLFLDGADHQRDLNYEEDVDLQDLQNAQTISDLRNL